MRRRKGRARRQVLEEGSVQVLRQDAGVGNELQGIGVGCVLGLNEDRTGTSRELIASRLERRRTRTVSGGGRCER